MLSELLPRQRRLRASPRVIKRKMSNYAVKKASHRHWLQPTKRPDDAIVILRS